MFQLRENITRTPSAMTVVSAMLTNAKRFESRIKMFLQAYMNEKFSNECEWVYLTSIHKNKMNTMEADENVSEIWEM